MAKKFLDDVELGNESIRAAVVEFMPYSFAAVNAQSKRFLEVNFHGEPYAAYFVQLCCLHAPLYNNPTASNLLLLYGAQGTTCFAYIVSYPVWQQTYCLHQTGLTVTDAEMQVEKRYNYTTPKTFLELIKLYKSVLARKRNQVQEAIDRLDTVSNQRTTQGKSSLQSVTCKLPPSKLFGKASSLRFLHHVSLINFCYLTYCF